jgi:hypothetical protein
MNYDNYAEAVDNKIIYNWVDDLKDLLESESYSSIKPIHLEALSELIYQNKINSIYENH